MTAQRLSAEQRRALEMLAGDRHGINEEQAFGGGD